MTESESKLKSIEATFYEKKTGRTLIEIYQALGIQFAFLSSKEDGYRQCHPWVKCRDFLHDALRSHFTKRKEIIYGFTYDAEKDPPLDTENIRLLVKRIAPKDPSEITREIMDSALSIVHIVEEYSGIKPLTKLYCTTNDKDIYVFEGASDWMESTFMVSLYTFFIRLGGNRIIFNNKEELDSKLEEWSKKKLTDKERDLKYLKTVYPHLYKIIEIRKDLKLVKEDGKICFESSSINTFHNYTGIMALCGVKGNGLEELKNLAEGLTTKAVKKTTKTKAVKVKCASEK